MRIIRGIWTLRSHVSVNGELFGSKLVASATVSSLLARAVTNCCLCQSTVRYSPCVHRLHIFKKMKKTSDGAGTSTRRLRSRGSSQSLHSALLAEQFDQIADTAAASVEHPRRNRRIKRRIAVDVGISIARTPHHQNSSSEDSSSESSSGDFSSNE
eukprot:IDg1728t1